MATKSKTIITLGGIGLLMVCIFWSYALLTRTLLVPTADTVHVPLTSPTVSPTPAEIVQQHFEDQVHVTSSQKTKTLSLSEVTQAQHAYWKSVATPSAKNIEVYHINFLIPTSDTSSKTSSIKAQVFVPLSHRPLPIVVYGSGTTGISPKCAPSLEDISKANIGNYYNQMVALASLGYVVIFPDYEGYGAADSSHTYFVAEQEARALIGSLVAADAVLERDQEVNPLNHQQLFFMGYSQGGHAALSAAAFTQLLPSKYSVQGIVGYAPALDLKGLLIDSPRLAPYLVYAYQQYYGIQTAHINSILSPKLLPTLENDVLNHCVDSIYSHYPESASLVYADDFLGALISDSLEQVSPEFAHYLEVNQGSSLQTNKPLLIIQGQKDDIVTPKTQKNAMTSLCSNHISVTYTSLANANHFQTPAQGTFTAHAWMQNVIRGTVRNDCPSHISE